jgi:hypothetical protein
VLQSEPALVDTFINHLSGELDCKILPAADGAALTPGTIHIAADPEKHVVFEPGNPPRLRMVMRDPVDGARPSATLLFGTIARAGVPATGAVLTGMGADGAKGLRLMRDAGSRTFVEDPATATVGETLPPRRPPMRVKRCCRSMIWARRCWAVATRPDRASAFRLKRGLAPARRLLFVFSRPVSAGERG